MERIKTVIIKLLKIIQKPEMRILPGQLAFFTVLSVIALVTLIGVVASLFGISLDTLVDFFKESIPKEVIDLLSPLLSGGFDFNIAIFIVMGFIFASNGPYSMITASNLLFNMNHSNYIKRRVKAFFMAMILVLLFFFIIFVLAFGNSIIRWILEIKALQSLSDQIYFLFILIKWPVAFILIFFTIKILYTIAPDELIPSRHMNRGAVFTMLGISLVTAVYSYYVSHFSNYSLFYGGLSNIIILMIWIYILSYIIVIGIAINANGYHLEKSSLHNSKETADTNIE